MLNIVRGKMESYTNVGGNSGIINYEIGQNFIKVEFVDGSIYRYTYASAGSANIEYMKQLARQGHGLNSFINKNIKNLYAEKER